MAKLREQAPLMRQPVAAPPQNDREELLRTLGQELDDQSIQIVNVVQRPGFFEVRGTGPDGEVYRFFSVAELRELSERRRRLRKQVENPLDSADRT